MLPGRTYTPEEILRIIWFRKWILLAAVVLFTTAAVTVSMRLPNQYKSETLILVIPQRVPESYVHSTVTMRLEDRLRSIKEQILSRSRLEKVVYEFNLYSALRQQRGMEDVVEQMRSNVTIDTVRDDSFKVTFVSENPRTAMIVADRLASMFIDENSRDRTVMAEGTNQFLESQLEDARRRLVAREKTLEEFRRRYAGELPSQLQTNLQVIQGTQNQIQNLMESINRDRDRRLSLERSVSEALNSGSSAPADFDASRSDPDRTPTGRAVDQLEAARNDLRALQLRLKPEHPDVAAKRRQVAELEDKVRQEVAADPTAASKGLSAPDLLRQSRARQYQVELDKVDRQIASKESEMARLRQLVDDYQHRVEAVPGHESEMTELMRDYETLQKMYSSLLSKKEDSKISANLEREQVGEQFRILDPARLPAKPFSPNRPLIGGAAAIAGLLFAAAFIAFLEYRSTGLRTEDEIVRTLVLPVVAAIPIMTAVADRERHHRWMVASAAATGLALIGLTAAVLWRFGALKGLH